MIESFDLKRKIAICLILILSLLLPRYAFADELELPAEKALQDTISGAEMMELLDRYVAFAAPEQLSAWEGAYPELRKSTEPLIRFDAMAALFLAAHAAGEDNIINNPFEEAESLNHNWDEDYLRWDLFGGFENNSSFYIGIGDSMPLDGSSYFFNLGRTSDGEHPFTVDPESNSLRVKDPATYEEARTAIFRLAASQADVITDYDGRVFSKTAVQAQEPRFIGIDEVGKYNTSIITAELLNTSTLQDVDKAALPYWTGYILENKIFANQFYTEAWEKFTAGGKYFNEEEIRYLAQNGFNCVRVLYSFSFLSDPNDIYSINVSELEQLDELISWCLKYNIHVMLSITGLPGRWNVDTEVENVGFNNAVFTDPAMEEAFSRYWKMLSRRYADIPNGVLSFELIAEPALPYEGENEDKNLQRYYEVLAPIAKDLWNDRADRIIIINDLAKNVPWQLAEIGCCLSLHTHIYMTDARRLEEGYGIKTKASWPMQYMPYAVGDQSGALKLSSDEGFTETKFRVFTEYRYGNQPYLKFDGNPAEIQGRTNDNGIFYWEAVVPEGTKEISFGFHDGGGCGVLQVELEQGNEMIYIPTTGWAQAFHGEDPFPTIRIEPDGNLTCLTGEKVDGEYIYNTYIKPFTDCAEKNGVSFVMTEIANDTLALSPEEYVEYNRVWLEFLQKYGIGWMYNCVHNIFGPRTLIWHNGSVIPFTHFSQWEDTSYAVNDDIMDLLKEYQ